MKICYMTFVSMYEVCSLVLYVQCCIIQSDDLVQSV